MMPGSMPIRDNAWKPTGKQRYRLGWRGRLVLQVEVAERTGHTDGPNFVWTGQTAAWRDATVYDLQRTQKEST